MVVAIVLGDDENVGAEYVGTKARAKYPKETKKRAANTAVIRKVSLHDIIVLQTLQLYGAMKGDKGQATSFQMKATSLWWARLRHQCPLVIRHVISDSPFCRRRRDKRSCVPLVETAAILASSFTVTDLLQLQITLQIPTGVERKLK